MSDDIATELRALRAAVERLEAAHGAQPFAVKRAVAARMMGVGVSKLDSLVRTKKVRTAEDSHLIPVSEIRRYCAPKAKRERKPVVGHRARQKHVDGQSEEAWSDVSRRVKARGSR